MAKKRAASSTYCEQTIDEVSVGLRNGRWLPPELSGSHRCHSRPSEITNQSFVRRFSWVEWLMCHRWLDSVQPAEKPQSWQMDSAITRILYQFINHHKGRIFQSSSSNSYTCSLHDLEIRKTLLSSTNHQQKLQEIEDPGIGYRKFATTTTTNWCVHLKGESSSPGAGS
jgi:hypothetical protein